MKIKISIAIALLALATPLFPEASANASTLQSGNLVLTLPDSVVVSGTEIGGATNPRNCSIKASLDSKSGTTIPLRAGAVVNLLDSTGYSLDNGYALADVEGLTHLDISMVFHCGSGQVTLKGPYRFTIGWRGSGADAFPPDVPVSVNFVASNPTPTPSPSASANSLQSQITDLNNRIADSSVKIADLTDKLTAANLKLGQQADKILELTTQNATLAAQISAGVNSPNAAQKIAAQLKALTLCYSQAKAIALSKRGTLSKQCQSL